MLKPLFALRTKAHKPQPPSGGCVLKRAVVSMTIHATFQPPSGGCVLKPYENYTLCKSVNQPPSGGCVLKRGDNCSYGAGYSQPPSGGCVLKQQAAACKLRQWAPAAFGRLCVETIVQTFEFIRNGASRLRAAVC